MSSTKTILVTGATGQQGGAVASSLLRQGQKVRVLTRNPDKAAGLAKAGAMTASLQCPRSLRLDWMPRCNRG